MNLKLVKKILNIVSVLGLIVGVLVLILALFDKASIKFGENANSPTILMLSSFVICAAAFFSGNAVNVMHVNKKLSFAAIALICLSTIGALIIFFSKFKVSVGFTKGLAVIAIATVLFVILVGTYLKLQKKYMILQIALYVLVFAIDVILTATIFGADLFSNGGFTKIFVVMCLVTFVLLGSTNIIGKKQLKDSDESVIVNNEKYVTIRKQEYEDLLAKARRLEELENK